MIELSYLGDLSDCDELALQLSTTGLSSESAASKAKQFAKASASLAVVGQLGRAMPSLALFIPGAIEILGKHTAYAGGRALVVAAERGFCMVASPRDDRHVIVVDARSGQTLRFAIDADLQPHGETWTRQPMIVARRMARDFPGACRGAAIAFCSDLPASAGLGDASALLAGIFLVLSEINHLPARDEYWHNIGNKIDLAGYLAAIETGRSFGTFSEDNPQDADCSIEDLTGSLCTEPGHISQFAYAPVEFEKLLPLPHGHVLAIGTSGVKISPLAMDHIPSVLAKTLADLWRHETGRKDPHLAAALGSSTEAVDCLKTLIERGDVGTCDRTALVARLEHFDIESGQIIPAVADVLAGADLRAFGRLIDRSQRSAQRLLNNQTPETVFLASSARRNGAIAATSFGLGFGGSVWAMVETAKADDFLTAWADEYRDQYAEYATSSYFFLTGAGPAAFRVR